MKRLTTSGKSSDSEKALAEFRKLLEIMDELREKCPWDRDQTLESLRKLTIEETYELGDAILRNDLIEIKRTGGPDASYCFLRSDRC